MIFGITMSSIVLFVALLVALFALLVVAFIVGRLAKAGDQISAEALDKTISDRKEEIAALLQEKEGIHKGGIKAEEAIKRWEELKRDHENIKNMRQELDDFINEENRRIDTLENKRSEAVRQLAETEIELAKVRASLEQAQTVLDRYPKEIAKSSDEWKALLKERQNEYDELQQKLAEVKDVLSGAEADLLSAKETVERLETNKDSLEKEVQSLGEKLKKLEQGQIELLKPYNERLFEEAEDLLGKIDDLKSEEIRVTGRVEEMQRKLECLDEQIRKGEDGQVELLEPYNAELFREAKDLRRKIDNLKSDETRMTELVTAMQGKMQGKLDGLHKQIKKKEKQLIDMQPSSSDGEEIKKKLGSFKSRPECLNGYDKERNNKNEVELLEQFQEELQSHRMNYPKRIIRAFHTALKVNELSPLTVLSGLSGTGKSQLPRAYARFFGIHFLHVPVEPGWDSPQDLLGFYDFVSERYRPTDRARALGHFDRNFADFIGIEPTPDWSQRMLIILLDEMNLARTEYYFSEFLSRLEMRGLRGPGENAKSRADAAISIDLPYKEGESPKQLYVPYNVLWVGTLNEDETTQALSDKVLDRANSIRFASPDPGTIRAFNTPPTESEFDADGYLPYQSWLEWSNTNHQRHGSKEVDEVIGDLAELMRDAGRGFGYRIAQSIRFYVDFYPKEGDDWRIPMIDQINMRLLPKLAGSEMTAECRKTLEDLKELCETRLNDEVFAKVLGDATENSENSQIFSWPGYTYEQASDDPR